MGMFQARKNADRFNKQLAARVQHGEAAAQSLKKRYAAKDAKASVIKHAVVGGIVAGPAGAVVGATAAKAKQDAERG